MEDFYHYTQDYDSTEEEGDSVLDQNFLYRDVYLSHNLNGYLPEEEVDFNLTLAFRRDLHKLSLKVNCQIRQMVDYRDFLKKQIKIQLRKKEWVDNLALGKIEQALDNKRLLRYKLKKAARFIMVRSNLDPSKQVHNLVPEDWVLPVEGVVLTEEDLQIYC